MAEPCTISCMAEMVGFETCLLEFSESLVGRQKALSVPSYLLPAVYSLLSTTYSSLSTVYHLPSPISCLLSTAHCLPSRDGIPHGGTRKVLTGC